MPGVTLPLDWTQAFAQKGATLIAGTGYQYGDTDFVEYSERLYVEFARELHHLVERMIAYEFLDVRVQYSASDDCQVNLRPSAIA